MLHLLMYKWPLVYGSRSSCTGMISLAQLTLECLKEYGLLRKEERKVRKKVKSSLDICSFAAELETR